MTQTSVHSLARTPSAPADVLLSATDLYVSRPTHTKSEKHVFEVLALNLLKETSDDARQRIAHMLMRHGDAPQAVLDALANDDNPRVAFPILRARSSSMTDTSDKQQSLAATDFPGQDNHDMRNHDMRNHDMRSAALPSQNVAAQDVTAQETPALKEDGLRGSFVDHFAEDLTSDKIHASKVLITGYMRLAKDQRNDAIAAAEMAVLIEMTSGGRKQPASVFKESAREKLLQAAMSGQATLLIRELSYLLGLPEDFARQAVVEDSGEAFTICLKAMDMPQDRASQIIIRIFGAQSDITQVRDLMALHRTVSLNAARLMVRAWATGKVGWPEPQQSAPAVAPQRAAAASAPAAPVQEKPQPKVKHQSQYQDAADRKAREHKQTSKAWASIREIERLLTIK
ncbi:MAG: DUF2336 domain-containing protein [Rhodobacteraceae bacterium]|nr:DUF2336 domain-containing protein [Paracoccaceae bacterium]